MTKLYRHIDEVLLAIALMYQRPGVSAWKRDVARRYLRRRFRHVAQRARVVGVRIAVVAGVAGPVLAVATWYRRRAAKRVAALPVTPAPHRNGADLSPPVTVAGDGSR
jgi:hypothetical protein